MSSSTFLICAIPGPAWLQPENEYGVQLVQLVRSALNCERRIAKGVNLEAEYRRYTVMCQRLEQEIALSGRVRPMGKDMSDFCSILREQQFPAIKLGASYLELLYRLSNQRTVERMGVCFIPPQMVRGHRMTYQPWTAQLGEAGRSVAERYSLFLEFAEQEGCGVVELQTCFHVAELGLDEKAALSPFYRSMDAGCPQLEIPDTTIDASESGKAALKKMLGSAIRKALAAGEPVAFTRRMPGDVVTETLNELVFVPPGKKVQPSEMRVVYEDGSEAEPFPLCCLSRVVGAERGESLVPTLRVGLMSMRDPDLDTIVDFYWFSNQEVSRTSTLAEADRLCLDFTQLQLRASADAGPVRIQLYHTGFLPAVLGFYRGLVKSLRVFSSDKRTAVAVHPYYWRGGDRYQPGVEWR